MELFEQKRRTPSINLTALIDILFLLIIFFVVSSKIIGESGIRLELPYQTGKSDHSAGIPILTMDSSLRITLEGKRITEQKLPILLKTLLQKLQKNRLLLNIDKKVPHGSVVQLMNQVRNLPKKVGVNG